MMTNRRFKIHKCRLSVVQKFLYNAITHFLATEVTSIYYHSGTPTLLLSQVKYYRKKAPSLLASLQNCPQSTQGRVALS